MAQRRMISLKVTDTDDFLEMPSTSQNLYFHLLNRADDDGFLGNSKKIMRMIRSSDDDMKVLVGKEFVIPFENGVCVIKHWRIHNLIRADRYTETIYKKEKRTLIDGENKEYIIGSTSGIPDVIPVVIPNGTQMEPQGRLGQYSLDKVNLGEREKTRERGEIPSPSSLPFENYFPPPDPKKFGNTDPLSVQITESIEKWNSFSNLPRCMYNVLNLPNIGEVNTKFDVFKSDVINKAIENLSQYIQYEKYKPTSFDRFIVQSIDRWVDSCSPWERYEEFREKSEDEKELEKIEDYLVNIKGTDVETQYGDKYRKRRDDLIRKMKGVQSV